VNDG